jgi:hypothetical protein
VSADELSQPACFPICCSGAQELGQSPPCFISTIIIITITSTIISIITIVNSIIIRVFILIIIIIIIRMLWEGSVLGRVWVGSWYDLGTFFVITW